MPTAMPVDWSEYPKTYWHCYVRLKEPEKRYRSLGILNDLTLQQVREQVVDPWQQRRRFSVEGVIIAEPDQVLEIRIVQTEQPQAYYEQQRKAETRGRNIIDIESPRLIPFWHGKGTDHTNDFLFRESLPAAAAPAESPPAKAFIVHGHDTAMLNEVALLLNRLDIDAIILKDRPNLSRTLIEKLEQNSDVGYAIILFTPDDVGRAKDEKELKPRARQNAVLELGYFIGYLGRKNVCALMADGLDRPSDIDGVGYIAIDSQGAWQMKLAREMRAAGLPVDLNKLA